MSEIDPHTGNGASGQLSRSEVAQRIGLALVALSVWTLFRIGTGITLEDAWITFRYAGNFATGEGLVFNPGERVMGVTTPLQALLLGLLGSVFGASAIPLVSNVLMFAAGLGAALLLDATLRRLGLPARIGLLAMALSTLHPDILWTVSGGMETPLVLFWMSLSLWALASGRFSLALVACALLLPTRVDGFVWAGVVGLCALLRARSTFLRAAWPAALIVAVWLTSTTLYYGSPLPHSVSAKSTVGTSAEFDLLSLEHLRLHLLWIYRSGIGVSIHANPVTAALLQPWLLLALLGGVRVVRDRALRALLPLVLTPLLLSVALYVGRSPRIFLWYLVPLTWCSIALGCVGINELGGILRARASRGRVSARSARAVLGGLALLLAGVLVVQGWHTFEYHRENQRIEDALRRELGLWLANESPPEATVAMEAIGYQGFFSGRRVIDFAGIVSPDVVRIHEGSESNAQAFERIWRELEPDYIVLRSYELDTNEGFHGGPMFSAPGQRRGFHSTYSEVRRFSVPNPGRWGRWGQLTVYRRTT